ncbi:Tolloid-like protein 1 [Armadillidium nasatum]|uniref:Tolloid-like protein 1 n=1 Tax=Armadillidium nasatum TaxID=96803 RepID=A0A5N5SPL2_9CRUS|nr:Tolloid-like protein 1 [Armadillidium nasatum]
MKYFSYVFSSYFNVWGRFESYSTVVKEFPHDHTDHLPIRTNHVPKILPIDSLNEENPFKISTEFSTDIITNTNEVEKTINRSWLDLTNRMKRILCTETFGDEEFFIRSPNYPFNYPAFTNCRFIVKRLGKSICGIIFTVLRFDVGPTGNRNSNDGTCSHDKVLIGNQVICGRLRRGAESFSRFTSSTFNLTFTSGNGFGSSGFLIKGKQTPFCLPDKPLSPPLQSSVPCDRLITEEEFNITSPSFPGLYPDDAECHYEVLQSNWNICGLLLTPTYFDVEGASYCMFDYVEVQGKRLCGNLTSKEEYYYMFETDKIDIRFRSDESVSKVGFNLKGKQISCNDLEYFQPIHSPLVATESLRESKAKDDFQNLEDIRYILSLLVKSGLPTDLINDSFSRDGKSITVDEENTTDYDFLSLVPNENESEVLEASQTRDRNNIQNVIQLEPVTDDNGDDYRDDDELNSPPVYFPIPNKFPRDSSSSLSQRDLLSSSTCDERHNEQVFIIQSVNYPNNYSNNLNCAYYIYRSSPDVCQVVNIAFTGENVITRFKSNAEVTDKGYLITVEQIDKECVNRGRKSQDLACDSVIRYDNFTIYSPGYPQWYPSNMWCTTTIFKSNPSIKSLEVFFQEFDLELSPQCEKDFLSIGSRRFCGRKSGNSYIFPFENDSIQLTLATNEDISSNGFRIYMKQVSDSISREPTSSPTVWRGVPFIIDFDVEPSPGCRRDYLQLGLRRLCGENYVNEIHNYHFSSDRFNVIFHSDPQESGKGFRIEVTQRSCLNTIDNNLQTPPPIITAPPPFTRPDPSKGIEFPTLVPPSRPYFPTNQRPYPNTGGSFPFKYDPNCMKNFKVIDNIKYRPATHPRPSKVIWPTTCTWCNKLYPYNYNYRYNYYNTYKRPSTSSVFIKPNQIYGHSSSQISKGRVPNVAGTYYYNNWQAQPQFYRVGYGRSISEKNKTFDNIPRDLSFSSDTSLQGTPQLSGNKILDFLNKNNNTIEKGSEIIENSFNLPSTAQYQFSSHNLPPQVYFPINEKPTDLLASGSSFLNGRLTPPSPAGPVMIVKELPPITKGNSDENFLLKLQNETPDFSQSVNLCNKSISLETFEMKSPGYPGPYYTNMNCYYLIYRNDISRCGLLLNIDMLDLPGSPSCVESYLSISGRRFCGSKENGVTVVVPFSPSSPIVIEFRSNTFYTGGGFSLKARQIPCNFTLSSGRNVFHSKNFENFADAVTSQSQRFETFVRPQSSKFVTEHDSISQNFLYDLNEDEKFLNSGFKPIHPSPISKKYVTVPWVGVRATKHPPYKAGLKLVGIVKRLKGRDRNIPLNSKSRSIKWNMPKREIKIHRLFRSNQEFSLNFIT